VPIPKTFRLQVQLLQLQPLSLGLHSPLQDHRWLPLGPPWLAKPSITSYA